MSAYGVSKVYNKTNVLAIFCSFALFAMSLDGFNREYASTTILLGQDFETILQLRKFDRGWLTYSTRGLDDLMQKCADALLTNESVRMSPQLQGDIGDSCQEAARTILVRNPGFPRALAVGLIAATGGLSPQAYGLATAAAPFEPWPLSVRLLAVERALTKDPGAVGADLVAPVSGDVARALQSDWGRKLVAGLYVRQAGLRALIEAAAKTRPPEEQRAFLSATRSLAAQNG